MTTPRINDDHLLYVVFNGRVMGEIQRTGPRKLRLRYDEHAVGQEWFTPLSLSMPGGESRYREKLLAPWLEGLLPDRPELLRQWRRRFELTDTDSFSLLRHVGEDVAGAAQFVRPDRVEDVLARPGRLRPLDEDGVAELLRRAKANIPITDDDAATGRFSLAGAQAKIALHRADDRWAEPTGSVPSTHIMKPAVPGMADQDIAELITMRTAADLDLNVATCTVEQFGDERAFVTRRYDRASAAGGRWQRIHQEDLCQALNVWPAQKYEAQGGPGAARVANLIAGASSRPETDAKRFAQALVYNWLVCGSDAHARNYSMLLLRSQARFAPLYDLNSQLPFFTGAGSDLSMRVGDTTFRASAVTRQDWMRLAPSLHVADEWLLHEIDRQSAQLPDSLADVAATEHVRQFSTDLPRRMLDNTDAWVEQRRRAVLGESRRS